MTLEECVQEFRNQLRYAESNVAARADLAEFRLRIAELYVELAKAIACADDARNKELRQLD